MLYCVSVVSVMLFLMLIMLNIAHNVVDSAHNVDNNVAQKMATSYLNSAKCYKNGIVSFFHS